ncbi:MAG: hypothetical protein FJW23_13835 [Acidimicrobiia bacterium]|nr:hypothetical protein [Acidimicrobiia bacterium]
MHLARAYQVRHGAWPIRDFADPGQMLAYLASAVAAVLFGPTLLTDVVLLILLLSVAAGVVFVIARDASGSPVIAVLAAAAIVVAYPRLYNAGKLFFPAVGILLAWRYTARPSHGRVAALGGWTACAFLWRHDLGVFMAAASMALVLYEQVTRPRVVGRPMVAYVAWLALGLLPWLAYVQWAAGLGDYWYFAASFVQSESRRTVVGWPGVGDGAAGGDAIAFYLLLALPLVAVWMAFRGHSRIAAARMLFVATLSLVATVVFLRDAFVARLADAIVAPVVLVAWIAGQWWRPAMSRRRVAGLSLAAAIVAGVAVAGGLIAASPGDLARRPWLVASRLKQASPDVVPAPEHLPLLRYLRECTAPSERVLVSGFSPQIPVLADRPFAGGQPVWLPGYATSPRDVQRALAQMSREQISLVVLIDGVRVFEREWPDLAAWLRQRRFVERRWVLDGLDAVVWIPAGRARDSPGCGPGDRR